jgi:hypothetical protein
MKIIIAVASLFVFAASAISAELPRYNIEASCKESVGKGQDAQCDAGEADGQGTFRKA